MSLSYSFAKKRVLVTGGGQGIGRQIVQRFYDDNAIVCTIDKSPELIQKLREELPNIKAETCDITDWKQTEETIQAFGPIEFLVNNAGVLIFQKLLDITEDMASTQLDVNVKGTINVIKTVAKGMIANDTKGAIVNLSSIGSRLATPGLTVYGATKAGVELITKSAALELGEYGIRINAIAPGAVDAPMSQSLVEGKAQIMPRLIIKRLVEPNEVANTALFLLSPLASMMTGETVVVDGGCCAC